MTETAPLPHLPLARRCPFDPPEELGRLRAQHPVSRLTYPDGHQGWLVTGYEEARKVLADPRFSARRELRHIPIEHPFAQQETQPALPGALTALDPPEHTHYRRLLTGQFTVHRMRRLVPRIEQITEERLDAMAQAGPPADLVREFALPIPSLVICEMIGVDYADHERFQRASASLFNLNSGLEQLNAAFAELTGIIQDLVEHRRRVPADDMFAGLVASGELSDAELVTIGLTLLVAGHETTANMLSLGTFALLEHPEQAAALRDGDQALVEGAVEELLRHLSIVHIGPVRAALEDVELGGQLIRRGESVTLSIPAANRDPERFPDPDRLDLTRKATGHLTFGHGVHQCLGQQLARMEMRVAFPALLRRFPTLRLAVPAEQVPLRTGFGIYGVTALPVAW